MIPQHVCEQIINISKEFSDIKEVLLFGSRVYGDHEERSDIDLAVLAPDISQANWLKFSEKVDEELDTLLKIDLVKWELAPTNLQIEISKKNKVLYKV